MHDPRAEPQVKKVYALNSSTVTLTIMWQCVLIPVCLQLIKNSISPENDVYNYVNVYIDNNFAINV